MNKNVFSLLIGIDDYKGKDLRQCVADIRKVKAYLNSLDKDNFTIHDPKLLLDRMATKGNIVKEISSKMGSLKDGDVFLIYYSGHGTQETSHDRFLDEHNGRIQCLVCHPEDGFENALLADKELRYLFSKLESKAHVIAIFDCCHSGDITRSHTQLNTDRQERRMSVNFPPRPEQNFIFSSEVPLEEFKNKRFNEVFPDKNIITLSAAASHESSWEDRNGGVFTRNLLNILKEKNSTLNYNDIAKLTRLSVQSTTREKQTPTIDVSGNQHFNQMTSWLSLNGVRFYDSPGSVTYNKSEGWLYSKGALHGIKQSDTIELTTSSGVKMEIEVGEVNFEYSTLNIPQSQMSDLDRDKSYTIIDNPILHKPRIYINDLDGEVDLKNGLKAILDESKVAEFTSNPAESDFDLNIFNQLVYFSFSDDAYRPLNSFYQLVETEDGEESGSTNNKSDEEILSQLKQKIESILPKIQKWHHYSELEVKDEFEEPPVKIELSQDGSTWTDIFNGQITLEPEAGRVNLSRSPAYKNLLCKNYKIRITNLTEDRLYVTPVILYNGRLEISYFQKDERSVDLDAGMSVVREQIIYLDHYMEVFNWEKECANYKFIVNNHSDLKPELPSILQDGLDEPYSFRSIKRGGGPTDGFDYKERNAIFFAKVVLNNTTFNQISGELSEKQDKYVKSEILSPFIERLYFDVDPKSVNLQLIEKPNNGQAKERGFRMFLGNAIDHYRRKRKFKRMVKRFPDKPLIVAEGDSWFLYPIYVKDTLDHLMTEYPVKSLAWAGDTLENYKKSGSLLKTVEDLNPNYVMISGGGNDIVGADIVDILNEDVAIGQKVDAYLNDHYDHKMKKLKDVYDYFFLEVSKNQNVKKILVHGYDYLRTDHATIVVKKGWVSKHMISKGITNADDRKRIVDFLIDEFNKMLEKLANEYQKVTYVKLLGTINKDEWYDEIHPNDYGYKKIADKFKRHLI